MLDLHNKTQEEIDILARKFGTELYYDLLAKYIALKEDYTRVIVRRNKTFIGPDEVEKRRRTSERRGFNFAINLVKIYVNQIDNIEVGKLNDLLERISKLRIPPNKEMGEHVGELKLQETI